MVQGQFKGAEMVTIECETKDTLKYCASQFKANNDGFIYTGEDEEVGPDGSLIKCAIAFRISSLKRAAQNHLPFFATE